MSEYDLSDLFPVAFCKDCGKLFTKVSRNICFECRQKESKLLSTVAEHVKARPGSKLEDIVTDLDIKEDILLRFISEGLLRRFKLQMTYPCRLCHDKISDGIICLKCSEELNQHINSLKATILNGPGFSDSTRYEYKAVNNKPDNS
jgi:hypothetical protein